MSVNIIYAILVTSLATFLSRFLGAISAEGIKETSKLFKWFNCLAYATLAALIARTVIFPAGVLIDASYLSRLLVVILSLLVFFIFIITQAYMRGISLNCGCFKTTSDPGIGDLRSEMLWRIFEDIIFLGLAIIVYFRNSFTGKK